MFGHRLAAAMFIWMLSFLFVENVGSAIVGGLRRVTTALDRICASTFGSIISRSESARAAPCLAGIIFDLGPSTGMLNAAMFNTLLLRRRLAIELLYDDGKSFSGTGGDFAPLRCLRAARRFRNQNRNR